MMKEIYVARVADDNSDALRVYFDKKDAVNQAGMYAAHLTDGEKKTHRVSVEKYTIEVMENESAEAAFKRASLDDEIYDPEDYEEVH